MDTQTMLASLSIVTLAIVVGFGIWLRQRARADQRRRGEAPGGGLDDL